MKGVFVLEYGVILLFLSRPNIESKEQYFLYLHNTILLLENVH